MNSCEQFQHVLTALARREPLDIADETAFERHVASCSRCAVQLRRQSVLSGVFARLAGEPVGLPSDPILEALKNRLPKPARRTAKYRFGVMAATVAAAVMLCLLNLRPAKIAVSGTATQISPEEYAAEFVPIPYADSASPDGQIDVVRVQMPRTTLAQYGLPVDGSALNVPVTADLAIGPDGVPRAIRLVR